MLRTCIAALTVAGLVGLGSARAEASCGITQPARGRTHYQEGIGPHPSFLSVDADPSGAAEVYYGYNQPGVNRPLLVGTRADSSGARVYLVSAREGTVPEPDAELDVRAGTQPAACVSVPAAGVTQRVP